MADYGLKITKDGSAVGSAADKDLVYSSKYNGMKIAKHNTSGAGTVSHGLSYVPMFLNFRLTSGKYRLDTQVPNFDDSPHVTSANIIFPNADNYYFIFIDNAE